MRQYRIFIGFEEVAGYYGILCKTFREMGHLCTFINSKPHSFKYEDSRPTLLERLISQAITLRFSTPRDKFVSRFIFIIWHRLLMVCVLLWAAFSFDIFIFSCGKSFLPNHRDLPFLKLLGKRLIFQFHGSDSRPPYLNCKYVGRSGSFDMEHCLNLSRIMKTSISRINRYATAIIDTPATAHFHERLVVNWLKIGLIVNTGNRNRLSGLTETGGRKQTTALHCPSSAEGKGTETIISIIDSLSKEGIDVKLQVVTNRPHKEVLEQLAHCDFAVDQVYSDYGMPGFATEAAWFGIPTIISGYAFDYWKKWLHPEETPPSFFCHPSRLREAVEKMATDANTRRELGDRASRFVNERWHPSLIAERYLLIAEDRAPKEWLFNPADISYLHGWGLPENRVKEVLRQIFTRKGPEALLLSDKPALLQRFLSFVKNDDR